MTILYITAVVSLLIEMGAIFTLVKKSPIKLLYYQFRKPLIWGVF